MYELQSGHGLCRLVGIDLRRRFLERGDEPIFVVVLAQIVEKRSPGSTSSQTFYCASSSDVPEAPQTAHRPAGSTPSRARTRMVPLGRILSGLQGGATGSFSNFGAGASPLLVITTERGRAMVGCEDTASRTVSAASCEVGMFADFLFLAGSRQVCFKWPVQANAFAMCLREVRAVALTFTSTKPFRSTSRKKSSFRTSARRAI